MSHNSCSLQLAMFSLMRLIFGVSVALLWVFCFSQANPQESQTIGPPPEARIVNGLQMLKNQFPFQIGIEQNRYGISCGGSLISKSHILTAAHCFFGENGRKTPTSAFTIRAGEHDYGKKEGTEQVRKIKKLILHPRYKDGVNDIAIIEVEPFQLNKAVQIVPMAKSRTRYNQPCTVSGWGYTYALKPGSSYMRKGGYPDIPRYVKVNIIEKERCKKLVYSTLAFDPNVLCAGVLAGGKDACSGDSGGPLVCQGGNRKPILVGIVGAGIGCGQKGMPGFYTNVAKMESWIKQTLNELQRKTWRG